MYKHSFISIDSTAKQLSFRNIKITIGSTLTA
ncbi:hypothetical protein T4D_13250 [Trichinella pseudospiralis]|uniref:Uncharacterized protein n=1 Tax=Trichinella pseudospiralis TaxID=6337 RepID=A0A0V1DLY2_TRIPS|nr:hypothetical protein T4D_13250 [Trichinella pseudospiralis]